ncbi:MAG: beta strand repeat-containing protein [Planctomycetota bacterium]
MADGATVISTTGTVTLTATDDVTLGGVSTGNGSATAVSITSNAGAIIDGGDTHTNIVANAAGAVTTLSSASGIGDGNALETTVNALDASTSNAGDVDIDESNAIDLLDVQTTDGQITVIADGQIVATSVTSGDADMSGGEDVTLMTTAGGITATFISSSDSAQLTADTGDVLVGLVTAPNTVQVTASAGAIDDATVDTVTDITADNVDLNAATGIGHNAALELSAATIAADNSGAANIDIDNQSATAVVVNSLTTVGGDIRFDQTGTGSLSFPGTVTSGMIGVDGGDILLTSIGDLTIEATADISSADGSGGALEVSGARLFSLPSTVGAGDIRITGGSLDTVVAGSVSTTAPVTLSALRDVLIGGVVEATGLASDITVNADTDNDGVGGVQIQGNGGLVAGRDITVAGSDVFATVGVTDSIDLQAGSVAAKTSAGRDVLLTTRPSAPADSDIVIGGTATAGGNLTVDANGNITLFSDVSAGGDVMLQDPVILSGDVTATATNFTVNGTLDDDGNGMTSSNLIVNASNITLFNGPVGSMSPIDSLTTDAAGTTTLNGSITAAGDITLNDAVTLIDDSTLNATNVTFGSTLDDDGNAGTGSNFEVNASGTTRFAGPIGGTNALESVTTDAPGTTELSSVVNVTTGTITFNDAVLLTESIQVNAGAGGAVAFNSTIDSETGEHNGITISGGDVSFDGDIGNGSNGDQTIGGLDVTTAQSIMFGVTGGLNTVRADGEINLGSGSAIANGITFDGTNLSVTTTGDDIRIDGPINLAGASTTLSTGATSGGDITFTNNAAIDSSVGEMNDLMLTAGTGSIFFNEDIGGSVAIGMLDVTRADGGVTFGQADTEMPDGTGPVDLINAFGGIDIGSGSAITGGIVLDPSGSTLMVVSSGGDIRFNGDVDFRATDVAIDSGAGTGGDIVFENGLTPQGSSVTDLTLTTGGGDVLVRGDLGTTANSFNDVLVTLADNVTVDGNVSASSFTQNAGTGTTSIGGTVTTSDAGTAGIDITTNSILFGGQVTTTGDGRVVLNNQGGLLQIGDGAAFSLNGSLTQTGTGDVVINANVSTTDDEIRFASSADPSADINAAASITLRDDVVFDTNGTATIRMRAEGDIALSRLVTGGLVSLQSDQGGIVDVDFSADLDATDDVDIVAPMVALRAAAGIGDDANANFDPALDPDSANMPTSTTPLIQTAALDTETVLIAGRNNGSGDVNLSNSTGGLLTIGTVDGVSGVSNDGSDNSLIWITNASPIQVGAIGTQGVAASDQEGVFNRSGGSVILTAIDGAGSRDNVDLRAPVEASEGRGSIVINAGDDIISQSHLITALDPALSIDTGNTATDIADRYGNIDLNAGGSLTVMDDPSTPYEIQTGTLFNHGTTAGDFSSANNVQVDRDVLIDQNGNQIPNRQIRYTAAKNADGTTQLTLANGVFLATNIAQIDAADSGSPDIPRVLDAASGTFLLPNSGVISDPTPKLVQETFHTPQIASDGYVSLTGEFSRPDDINLRLLVSWGDDTFSYHHVLGAFDDSINATDPDTGSPLIINGQLADDVLFIGPEFLDALSPADRAAFVASNALSDSPLRPIEVPEIDPDGASGQRIFAFEHFYDLTNNAPDPADPAAPIPIRVFLQGPAGILEVDSNDDIVAYDNNELLLNHDPDNIADDADPDDSFLENDGQFLISDLLAADLENAPLETANDPFGTGMGARVDTYRPFEPPAFTGEDQTGRIIDGIERQAFNTRDLSLVNQMAEPAIVDALLEEAAAAAHAAFSIDPNDPDNDPVILPGQQLDQLDQPNSTAGVIFAEVPTSNEGDLTTPVMVQQNDVTDQLEFPRSSSGIELFVVATAASTNDTEAIAQRSRSEDSTATERIVWLKVLRPTGETVDEIPSVRPDNIVYQRLPDGSYRVMLILEEIPLNEEVLDDLPGLIYSKLPDGSYQIWLQEPGEKRQRLIRDITIRDGKPASEEDGSRDRPPTGSIQSDNVPASGDAQNTDTDQQNDGQPDGRPAPANADGQAAIILRDDATGFVQMATPDVASGSDQLRYSTAIQSASGQTSPDQYSGAEEFESAWAAWGQQMDGIDASDLATDESTGEEGNGNQAAASALFASGLAMTKIRTGKWKERAADVLQEWDEERTRSEQRRTPR